VTIGAPLADYLADLRRDIELGLTGALASSTAPDIITNAMRYSLLAGGKRLRPCLTLAAAEATGLPIGWSAAAARDRAMPAAIAIEMVHSYSLIHDDLPAMDNDALRRGRPTSHMVHGDGLAILAGDGLLTEAFGVIAWTPPGASRAGAAEATLSAIAQLAAAAGAAGMVGGQAIDLAAAGRVPGAQASVSTGEALEDMHARKTGALIRAAATIGATLVGATDDVVRAIDDYARELGLAFQIIDDVLDVEGSREALGKTAGKDAAAGKPTYPALYGLADSRRLAGECVARAHEALGRIGLSGRLAEIADWSLQRQG
jgi:geranylgeranyl diphosphate synthase type II